MRVWIEVYRTAELPYVPNQTEDTTKQFISKCQMLRTDANKKNEQPPNQELKALLDRAHEGDAKMRAKMIRRIEAVLHYENDK